ncbi:MAG: hypothetical protein KAS32_12685, partial [Candidatus Peribacteraceae bacterium]|nr:hypothetical protein [Candidatus Peribacteraceae bacterium]
MSSSNSIELWASTFYLLEELSLLLSEEQFMHSKIRLKSDIEKAKKEYSDKFASLLFDTLFKMALGEARHAKSKGHGVWIKGIEGGDRGDVFHLSELYNPEQCLESLEILFGAGSWKGCSYGGKPWYRIVRALGRYGDVPNVIFVDSCICLSHNGGLAFNKEEAELKMIGLNGSDYKSILDGKQKFLPSTLVKKGTIRSVFTSVFNLIERTKNSNFISSDDFKNFKNLHKHDDVCYTPIKYKKQRKMQLLGGYKLRAARKMYNNLNFENFILNDGPLEITKTMLNGYKDDCSCENCKFVELVMEENNEWDSKDLYKILFPVKKVAKKTTKKTVKKTTSKKAEV